jgi:hypothetical protein
MSWFCPFFSGGRSTIPDLFSNWMNFKRQTPIWLTLVVECGCIPLYRLYGLSVHAEVPRKFDRLSSRKLSSAKPIILSVHGLDNDGRIAGSELDFSRKIHAYIRVPALFHTVTSSMGSCSWPAAMRRPTHEPHRSAIVWELRPTRRRRIFLLKH